MTRPHQEPGQLRIGELSRRVGVNAELLRAWERRYAVLMPTRTSGGFRLYGAVDEQRIRRMLRHIEGGLSPAEAARLALSEDETGAEETRDDVTGAPSPDASLLIPELDPLRAALDAFDEARSNAVLDRLLQTFTLETVLRDAVLPSLRELGRRWRDGEVSIAQEHFASALLRGRLLGLARGWGRGSGPLALLACVPGDQHDLGLTCFGLALRSHGWRITFLGQNTPFSSIAETAHLLQPAVVVLTAMLPGQLDGAEQGLADVAAVAPLAIAGDGASGELADSVGARYLADDPVTAAAAVAQAYARASK